MSFQGRGRGEGRGRGRGNGNPRPGGPPPQNGNNNNANPPPANAWIRGQAPGNNGNGGAGQNQGRPRRDPPPPRTNPGHGHSSDNGSGGNGLPTKEMGQMGLNGGERKPRDKDGSEGRRQKRRLAPDENEDPARSRDDVVVTKMKEGGTKIGAYGTAVQLLSNYFKLTKKADWGLYKYRVDFKPDEETTKLRKALFRHHAETIGTHIFDGYDLYTVNRIHPDPLVLHSLRDGNESNKVELTIKLTTEIQPVDATMLHFYNIMVRKCLQGLDLTEINRNFFDPRARKVNRIGNMDIEFWPGYVTSMRQCENDVLLRVEIKHKLVRSDSVLTTINPLYNTSNYQQRIKDAVVNTVVLTTYNKNKTYKISDVDFSVTPMSTFDQNGVKVTYMGYYKERYNITIKQKDQPLLVAMPKKREQHRGIQIIYLVPELCQTTGLTDSMRSNFSLMRDVATHLHISPADRIGRIETFMTRIRETEPIQKELKKWGLEFNDKIVKLPGRTLNPENIFFGLRGGVQTKQDGKANAEWTLQSNQWPMSKNASLRKWILIAEGREAGHFQRLIATMQEVAGQLGFQIPQPCKIYQIPNGRPQSYSRAIVDGMGDFGGDLDLIFTLVPNNNADTYAEIKKKCYLQYGVSSQVFLRKHLESRNFKSIVTKLVIQINAKLGGIPWEIAVPRPIQNAMMVGFDVYHSGVGENKKSVGALVASTNVTFGEYYSTTSAHPNREELSASLCTDLGRALLAYKTKNNRLPDTIFFFRDGVGEGQLGYVYHTELDQIKTALRLAYQGETAPQFVFIVVTKRIETRIFTAPSQRGPAGNPLPGTVVDDVITLPERHDFFLVSQTTRNGTVSPTAYHVLHNESLFKAGNIQMVAYKLCHLYFNCSTSIAVPAPCQYAHKLAYLNGMFLQGQCKEELSNRLYYL